MKFPTTYPEILQRIQNLDPITNEYFSPVIINDIENATHNRIEILAPRNRPIIHP